MELSKLFGLPAHPLLVHIPIVLVPVTAIIAVWIAISAKWRGRLGIPLVGLSAFVALASILAAGSGEALEESVKRTSELHNHTELGDSMKLIAVLLFVVIAALVFVGRMKTPKVVLVKALSVATIAVAILATFWIIRVGHSGAKATWSDVKISNG